ncbi:hypothetical protein BDV23DRAFT_41095 [Aspergillus alliaceus]|uniref:Uncharacterized protein n=1 Tax=Petromyces alliaceus TaxID=209559 RepID=A0A5N7BRI2_PETAA|nr:hypothetical protein BDV23DRAFT_41095 [Aspergillus alliaceus]
MEKVTVRCFALRFSRIGFKEGPAFNLCFSLCILASPWRISGLRGFFVHFVSHFLFPGSLPARGFFWIPTSVFQAASGWDSRHAM